MKISFLFLKIKKVFNKTSMSLSSSSPWWSNSQVQGSFKHKVGPEFPAKFTCITKKEHIANILDHELVKKKEKYKDPFELNKIVCSEEK